LVLATLQSSGWRTEPVVMEPDATGQVHTDMPHINEAKARLRPGVAVLSVGSGTITDIAKHGAFLFQQETGARAPFVVYQTAFPQTLMGPLDDIFLAHALTTRLAKMNDLTAILFK